MINVSWQDAKDYAQWLSKKTDKLYRLPTEAEWEYAIRAGTETDFYWESDASNADDFTWFYGNSKDQTHPVGKKNPNANQLYDMSGNVREWAEDCWHDNYHNASSDGSPWLEQNGGNCGRRVLRGGSWFDGTKWLRSATRDRYFADYRGYDVGFRLAQD